MRSHPSSLLKNSFGRFGWHAARSDGSEIRGLGGPGAIPTDVLQWAARIVFLAMAICLPLYAGAAEGFNATNATTETLVGWAQCYGSTPVKKRNRELARDELFARGGESLQFLLEHIHLTNETVRILVDEMMRSKLPHATAAPVLGACVRDGSPTVRRVAVYYLGYTDATNFTGVVLPLLGDDVVAGAAARTLGKWQVRAALPGIVPLLDSDKEPRRVVAVNAMRDIGDPAAIPALLRALGDDAFTVRKVAARALATLGRPAEEALLQALPACEGVVQREIVRTLGAMQSRRAVKPLRRLLARAEGGLRSDIAQALRAIDPERAGKWVGEG